MMRKIIPLLMSATLTGHVFAATNEVLVVEPASTAQELKTPRVEAHTVAIKDAKVYVVPVEGEINHNRFYILRSGLERAKEHGADAIVLDMKTPGGAVFITQDMIDLLMDQDVPTFTYVRRDAYSAGAIIAMATDYIYMSPGAVIGDAMPVIMGDKGYADVDDANREKMVSGVDAMIRSIAERKHRDVMVARCMVRRELAYSIGDTVICKEGEILTMTNLEAQRTFGDPPRPLLSEGTAESIEEMLEMAGFENAHVITHEKTGAESLAAFLKVISPFLLMMFMFGFYIEMNTPGFGLGGILAIVGISLFFLGQHAAGLAGYEDIAILVLGLVLLFLEIFVTPGFGILGISGLALILGSLISMMVANVPPPIAPGNEAPGFSFDHLVGLGEAIRNLSVAIVGTGFATLIAARYLPDSRFVQSRLVLNSSTSRAAGFTTSDELPAELVGTEVEAVTDLAPSGKILIDGRRRDAMSQGEFIASGTRVVILSARGNRIVVETAPSPEA